MPGPSHDDAHAVMFDLDGTLLDTLKPIASSGNHMLRQFDKLPLAVDRYRYLAGQGLRYLVEHALQSDDPEQLDRGEASFQTYYRQHGNALTAPYPGIEDMLDQITAWQIPMAVLSNKRDAAVKSAVQVLLPHHRFALAWGEREGVPLKPDPGGAIKLAEQLGVEPARWVYVGDTQVDMKTGRAAGMMTVGVTWGFRDAQELWDHGADAVIDQPHQLLKFLRQDASV